MKKLFFLFLFCAVALNSDGVWAKINKSAVGTRAVGTRALKTELAERAALISAIENKILRNKTELAALQKNLSEIEQTRETQTRRQKSVHEAFIRLLRRPDNMPLVAGLDLVRGEKIISDLQNRSVKRLNHLVARNSSIAQLTADIQSQQAALRTELQKRRTAHKKIEQLLSKKRKRNNKNWAARAEKLSKNRKNASALISAVIAAQLGKKYTNKKNRGQSRFLQPGAGLVQSRFGEKNRYGIHALGVTFSMLPAARIVAPAGGLVVFAGSFGNYGKTIILASPGGYHILLAGLVRLDVQAGDAVFTKEPLGLMPQTIEKPGGKTSVKLYFELRHLGRPINPEPLLTQLQNP